MDVQNKRTEDASMVKLKPCPWCGHIPEIYTEPVDQYDGTILCDHYIRCRNKKCPVGEISTKYFDTINEAIEAWNRRAET